MSRGRKKNYVPFDKYEIFDLARDLGLDAGERWLLVTLTFLMNWRGARREWSGTISELHDYTAMSRTRLRGLLEGLARRGLIEIVEPFRQNGQGVVLEPVYDRLVSPNPNATSGSTDAARRAAVRAGFDPETNRNRVGIAQHDAIDQGEEAPSRKGGSKEEEEDVTRPDSDSVAEPKLGRKFRCTGCNEIETIVYERNEVAFCALCEPMADQEADARIQEVDVGEPRDPAADDQIDGLLAVFKAEVAEVVEHE